MFSGPGGYSATGTSGSGGPAGGYSVQSSSGYSATALPSAPSMPSPPIQTTTSVYHPAPSSSVSTISMFNPSHGHYHTYSTQPKTK